MTSIHHFSRIVSRLRLPRGTCAAAMAAVAALSMPAYSQDDVPIRTEPVAGSVSVLFGRGGNIGVSAGADGVFMIDDQYAPMAPKIRAAIAKLSDQPPRFVINTHWHGDHTGGNESFGEAGALIVAHDNVRERLSTAQVIEFFGAEVDPSPAAALPVITFTDEVTFHLNGDTIRVFHVPHAHTDGDALVHFEQADVIHAGDTFFNLMYPFIDVGSGGDLDGMILAADVALDKSGPDTKIIPGHGPVTDKAGLQAYRDMLAGIRDRVQALITSGASQEEVIAAKPTAAFDGVWGGGFIKPDSMATFAYQSLAPDGDGPSLTGTVSGAASGAVHGHGGAGGHHH